MSAPTWLNDAVFYQIFPDRFANGDPRLDPADVVPWASEPTRDNFFGGDLLGIREHLGHITSLGANALYLTPIFEASTNHRYDTTDYFSIDHRLGTLEDFRNLLAACHEEGIRVVLDAVLNHCGEAHPAFRDAGARRETSPYTNWFSIEGYPITADPQPNYRTCSGCWYLPKWNVYNPEVRRHHYEVAQRWIAEGIDGWRLDVPYFINDTFWRGFRDVVKGLGEDLYIVAEEWRDPEQWLQGDMADGTMNYTLRDLILGFTADRTIDAAQFAVGVEILQQRIPEGYHNGMLNLLGSHDTERLATRCQGDMDTVLSAYALMFASQGAPMVYYGDEIGMEGDNDPGCRGAFRWDTEQWNENLWDRIRRLVAMRRSTAALRFGSQEVKALDPDTVMVVRRHCSEEVAAIITRKRNRPMPCDALAALASGRHWDGLADEATGSVLSTVPPEGAFLRACV